MARQKEMLKDRDRYATQFAVVKVAEMLRDAELGAVGIVKLRVEDYDSGTFDDVVEFRRRDDGREDRIGWQIKKYTGTMPVEVVEELLTDLAIYPDLSRGMLGIARFVSVKGGGRLSTLEALCQRAGQPGVNLEALAGDLNDDERRWISRVPAAAGETIPDRLALLARFGVRELGDEDALRQCADDHLARAFENVPLGLRDSIESWIQTVSGAVDITALLLESEVVQRYRKDQPGIITRAGRRSARREYLDAMHRATERLRPLQAISHRLFANTHNPTLASVYVKPTVFTGSGRERAANGIPLDMVRIPGARVAILGDLGTGKSVALETLRSDLAAVAATDTAAPLPVLVHARMLCDGSWREALAARTDLPRDRIAAVLEEPWILLVDGVDETDGDAWDSIDNISRGNGKCVGVVAAARPTAPPPQRDSYEVMRLRLWTHTEVERFLAKWKECDPDAVALVRHAIKSGVLRRTLLLNPLIATLCVHVAAVDRSILTSRSGLLGRVANLLFEAWRRIRRISPADFPWSKIVQPLGQLAIEYLKGGGRPLSATRVRQELRNLVPHEEYAVQHEAEWQLGILVPDPEGTLDFVLRPVAEYLAGEVIATMDDDQVANLVAAPWALEPMRIALTLFADSDQVDRVVNLIRWIAVAAVHGAPALETHFLRPLLVAIRVAADLRDAMAPVAELLAAAITHLVADETSSWIGDVVAEEARNLAAVGGPCWDALLDRLRSLAQRFSEEPVGWYAAQPERPASDWIPVLLHSAADVRAVAIERLAPHVADENVRGALVAEIWDEGYVIGGTPPAVLAGAALRHAPRDAKFGPLREMWLEAVDNGGLIASVAAALALGPSEEDLPLLVRALRAGSASFTLPPGVIAEIASSPAGERALDEGWPDWREPRFQQAPLPRPSLPTHGPPPPSHGVRVRIAKLLAPALATLSDDDLRLFMARTQYSRDHMLVDALEGDPSVADRIELRHVPLDAQRKVGEAALQLRSLRDRLVALWSDTDLGLRSEYPGLSLEPLVEDGDAAAATIYAEWLPNSPYAWIKSGVLDEPRPGVLGHPTVLKAARALATQLIHNATFGRPDGSRVARGVTGNMLGQISLAWRNEQSILETLLDWLRDDDDESFNGALRAFWGVPLTPEIMAAAQDALARRLASLHYDAESSLRSLDARFWLIWIDEMRITASLRTAITPLVTPSTYLGCVAGAVVLPLLDPEDAAKLAAAMAPFGITLDEASLDREMLRRYVLAAENAWVTAAVSEIEQGWLMSGSSGLRLMELVSSEHRAMIAEALLRSPAFRAELRWTRAREDDFGCVRPADIVRKVAFDLGL